jgi:hypothetical protein
MEIEMLLLRIKCLYNVAFHMDYAKIAERMQKGL